MKRLVLVINGKGGVGKSFLAINLVQYLLDRGIARKAIDTDNENSTLNRIHKAADLVDLEEPRQIDRMLSVMQTATFAVVDCRAATSDLFLKYFDEVDLNTVLSACKFCSWVVFRTCYFTASGQFTEQ